MFNLLFLVFKRYPQTPRKVRFDINFDPKDPVLDPSVLYCLSSGFFKRKIRSQTEGSFSQGLFNNKMSMKIRDAAKNSKFIRRMAAGTLDPDVYGGYMVQDAACCFNAVEAFDYAVQQMERKGKLEFSSLY